VYSNACVTCVRVRAVKQAACARDEVDVTDITKTWQRSVGRAHQMTMHFLSVSLPTVYPRLAITSRITV
jgi:hypothetical protein